MLLLTWEESPSPDVDVWWFVVGMDASVDVAGAMFVNDVNAHEKTKVATKRLLVALDPDLLSIFAMRHGQAAMVFSLPIESMYWQVA